MTIRYTRASIITLWAGLTLTVLTTLMVYVDRATSNVLASHIHSGYPSFGEPEIADTVSFYVTYLSILGALGGIGWAFTIWSASRGHRSARWTALGLFFVGASVEIFDLLVRDTSGDTGLPPLLGWTGLLPSLAGLVAVALMWRRTSMSEKDSPRTPTHAQHSMKGDIR